MASASFRFSSRTTCAFCASFRDHAAPAALLHCFIASAATRSQELSICAFRGRPMLRAFCEAWVLCFCLSLSSRAQRSTAGRSAFCISRVPHASRLLRSVGALLLLVIVIASAAKHSWAICILYFAGAPCFAPFAKRGCLAFASRCQRSAAKHTRAICILYFAGAPCFAPFAKHGCLAFACHCHRERSEAQSSDSSAPFSNRNFKL